MIKKFNSFSIMGIAACVPETIREMRELEIFKNSREFKDAERMIKSTGVERSRLTDSDTTAADLCEASARKLFADLNVDPSSIDALVFVTVHPDSNGPSSHQLQHKLGLGISIPCFDLAFGCSGYIYGLLQAALLTNTGIAKRVLVLAGETVSKVIKPGDHTTEVLFGDAGSATIIEDGPDGIHISVFSDGSGFDTIRTEGGAFRARVAAPILEMNGPEVFGFVANRVPGSIQSVLDAAGLDVEDIHVWALHQANRKILELVAKMLKIDQQKMLTSLGDFGNTGSPSIPLSIVVERDKFAKSERSHCILSGFGVGLSWGVALVNLEKTRVSALVTYNKEKV